MVHRKIFLPVVFALFILLATGCQAKPSRPPLSVSDVKTLAAEFDRISAAHVQAYNDRNLALWPSFFTEDVQYSEPGNKAFCENIECLVNTDTNVLHRAPDFTGKQNGTFIGRGIGVDVWEFSNYEKEIDAKIGGYETAYDMYKLRDGKIAEYWFFWGEEAFTGKGATFAKKPLQDYQTAWSSGDPKAVAALYDQQAERTDTLFNENQRGQAAIEAFATQFFAWYPGVRLEYLRGFELATSFNPLRVGGIYALHVTDRAGKPCNVKAVLLLALIKNKITEEQWFYSADSLLACGWAR